jgi:calcium/calmodulin-dependent protein kinase I
LETSTEAGSSAGGKRSLSNIAKGAIFREVVMAKVREAKEQEAQLQVEKDAQDKAKRNSFQG